MTFKEKLVILRKSKGLTQDEFASAVGVSRQAVYKWESGQSYPEVPKLLEMKLLFTISIDELLDDSYDIPVPEKKRRKRISKETMRQIEESVEKQIKVPAAPKAAPAPKVAPAPKAAPAPEVKIEATPAPVVEPKPEVKVETAPEVKISTVEHVPEIKAEPAPQAEPQASEEPTVLSDDVDDNAEPAKKGGFFGFFRRK